MSFFRSHCDFIAGAASIESLPEMSGHPEIAFIGRSNVGKSSLVNAIVEQKALARTSQNPGATKQLNFFLLGERLMLVDMPGYGFAKVGQKQIGEWDRLIKHYLTGRANLKRAFLLIDARRGIMPIDEQFMPMLDESAVSFQVILTKIDQVPASQREAVIQATVDKLKTHPAAHPIVIATSAVKKDGIEVLQEQLLEFIVPS